MALSSSDCFWLLFLEGEGDATETAAATEDNDEEGEGLAAFGERPGVEPPELAAAEGEEKVSCC